MLPWICLGKTKQWKSIVFIKFDWFIIFTVYIEIGFNNRITTYWNFYSIKIPWFINLIKFLPQNYLSSYFNGLIFKIGRVTALLNPFWKLSNLRSVESLIDILFRLQHYITYSSFFWLVWIWILNDILWDLHCRLKKIVLWRILR